MWIITIIDANGEKKYRQFPEKWEAEEFCDCLEACNIKFTVRYIKLRKVNP